MMMRWAALLLLLVGLAAPSGVGAQTEIPPTPPAITVPTLTSTDLEGLLNSYNEPMGELAERPMGMGLIGIIILAIVLWFVIPRRR